MSVIPFFFLILAAAHCHCQDNNHIKGKVSVLVITSSKCASTNIKARVLIVAKYEHEISHVFIHRKLDRV
jgi:hypothetical protein